MNKFLRDSLEECTVPWVRANFLGGPSARAQKFPPWAGVVRSRWCDPSTTSRQKYQIGGLLQKLDRRAGAPGVIPVPFIGIRTVEQYGTVLLITNL